jgi:putative ATP-dependent endonuclease of OLD family
MSKSQLELLSSIREGFAENGHQVICTTHSPFIINAVHPQQIRLLEKNAGGKSESKTSPSKKRDNSKRGSKINRHRKHVYLFFARQIIIVEGESEDRFITALLTNAKQASRLALHW